ncbi:hypothetical protein Patl1_37051 [Pistacia atlantica]|nr:hypothetical protein Patl1_37051 [Pistacia atlantica]
MELFYSTEHVSLTLYTLIFNMVDDVKFLCILVVDFDYMLIACANAYVVEAVKEYWTGCCVKDLQLFVFRDTNGLTAENSELKLRLQTMKQQQLNFIVPLRDAYLICGHVTSTVAAKLPLAATKQPQGAATAKKPTAAVRNQPRSSNQNPNSSNKITPSNNKEKSQQQQNSPRDSSPNSSKKTPTAQKGPSSSSSKSTQEQQIISL